MSATSYPPDFVGAARPLAPGDFRAAAAVLQLDERRIRAVDEVESRGRGFHPDSRRPVILYEPHVFHRLTRGKFSDSHPEISYPTWGTKPYPASQSIRYAQLIAARELDEAAALSSASWGRFQIMGFNHAAAGFSTPQAFVAAMCAGEGEHLMAFARFVKTSPRAMNALRLSDWAGFARWYNGEGYAQHGYDQRLKTAYARLCADPPATARA